MRKTVWAPHAKKVELLSWSKPCSMEPLEVQLHDETAQRTALQPLADGYHSTNDAPLTHGMRYAFSLDGGRPLPDPASRFQPEGVHAPSCFVDFEELHFQHNGFRQVPLGSAIIYELHIGTFTKEGTFDSAIQRLDHLKQLGVTHIEVMPIAAFPGQRGWGYDGVDLSAPHQAYGGPEGFARFVDACHGHGLAVLLDVVYNHLGPSGNYLGQYGPYFSSRYHTPWGDAVNFDDRGSDEVRRFLIDSALSWMKDYQVDGLRLDAVHEIYDNSARHFLQQLREEVHSLSLFLEKPLVLIAESASNDPRNVRSPDRGGHGLDSQWSDDFHHAIHALVTGEQKGYYEDFGTLRELAEALRHGFVFRGHYSNHRGYSFGASTKDLRGDQFVVFSQNHDQIGNRAQGERLSLLTSPGLLKIAAALTLLSPYIPLLFMGEEWGSERPFQYFTHHTDQRLAHAVTQGRKHEFSTFGWKSSEIPDPQDSGTFERSQLNWLELEQTKHKEILLFYQELVKLRRTMPDLGVAAPDRADVCINEQQNSLCLHRGRCLIACNFGKQVASISNQLALDSLNSRFHQERSANQREIAILLASTSGAQTTSTELRLPPESVTIFLQPIPQKGELSPQ